MKVILLNGSPHQKGTTMRALIEATTELNKNGIETEIITVGDKPVRGCIGCGYCAKNGACVINDDLVNGLVKKIAEADGLIIGSPVYYASITGTLKCVLDRVFYSSRGTFAFKPAAAVTVARRAGTTSAFDEINKYFLISNMPVVASTYWNNVHGANATDAEKDGEGLQTVRNLAKNMAWLIKNIEAGKEKGIELPKPERTERTNFIR